MEEKEKDILFHGLYQEQFGKLSDLASALVSNASIGEDLAQETFLRAWQHIEELLSYKRPDAWLVRTLRNVIGDYYRLRSRLDQLEQSLSIIQRQSYDDQPELKTIYGNLIDADDLQLLIWFYCDGYSQEEISAKLKIKNTVCRKRIQRAKERFQEALKNEK